MAPIPAASVCREHTNSPQMGQIVCLPLRLKLQDKEASFRERLRVCLSLLSAQCPEGGRLPRTMSLSDHSPLGPRNASPTPAARARRSRGVPWGAVTKNGALDIKTWTPDA